MVLVLDSSYGVMVLLDTINLRLLTVLEDYYSIAGSMATGVAVDAASRIYVADSGHSRVLVYQPTPVLLHTAWIVTLCSTSGVRRV